MVLLDEQLADHVGDERGDDSAEEGKNKVGVRLGEIVGVAGAEDEEDEREVHQRGTPVAEILDDNGEAKRKKRSLRKVNGWKRSNLPEVIDWDQEKDGQIDVEEGLGGGIAEESDDAGQSRDEDDDRHAAAG